MSNIRELADKTTNKNFQQIYKLIAGKYTAKSVNDAIGNVAFSIGDLNEIKDLQYEEVKANLINDSVNFQSLEDARKSVVLDIQKRINKSSDYVKDGFYNPMNNIGTLNDPGNYNASYTPVSMSPNEASSYYGSRGVGGLIIDKKSKVPFLNGFQFIDGLEPEDLKKLTDYAKQLELDRHVISAVRDGLIYGGSSLTPVFKKDSYESYPLSLTELMNKGIVDIDCIDHFITADRWNMVVIPSYNLTAKDYLKPETFYLPLGSMKLHTSRSAIVKPYPLPYWVAIRQLGWSVSDYEGYIRSLLGYNIIIASIPIMAQQMSLLMHELPLDGILAQNGVDSAKDFLNYNESQLRSWSMNNPRALNSFGKITVIERNYNGFRELIETYREDVGANAHMPVSSIFYLQPKGMSAGNSEDVTLKQSESIQMIEAELKSQLKPIIEILVYSCFGTNSEQAKNAKLVNIDFNSPVTITHAEKATTGGQFVTALTSLMNSGIPADVSINMLRQFFPDFDINEEDMSKITMPNETEQPSNLFGNLNIGSLIK